MMNVNVKGNGMNGVNGGNNMNWLEEQIVKAEAKRANELVENCVNEVVKEFGLQMPLDEKELKELAWKADEHVGKVIGYYLALEMSRVGATTVAGDILMAIRTMADLEKVIDVEKVKLGSNKVEGFVYSAVFGSDADTAVIEGRIGGKTQIAVVTRAKAELIIEDRLAKLDVEAMRELDEELDADGYNPAIRMFVEDITLVLRACQEIEIDITKDKSLKRILDLVGMIAYGAYVWSQKFKAVKATDNMKELRLARVEDNEAELKYELKVGIYNAEVTSSSVEIKESEELGLGIEDNMSKLQKALLNNYLTNITSPLLGIAKHAGTDVVIDKVLNDLNTFDKGVTAIAEDMAVATRVAKAYMNNLNFDESVEKEVKNDLHNDMAAVLQNTHARAYYASPFYGEAKKQGLGSEAEVFSTLVVGSELFGYNETTKSYGFTSSQHISVVRRYERYEYLQLIADPDKRRFSTQTYKAYGVAADLEIPQGFVVEVEDGKIYKAGDRTNSLGMVLNVKLEQAKQGRFLVLERDENGQAIIRDCRTLNSLRSGDETNMILAEVELNDIDGEFDLNSLVKKQNMTEEEFAQVDRNRKEYLETVIQVANDCGMHYNYAANAFVINAVDGYDALNFECTNGKFMNQSLKAMYMGDTATTVDNITKAGITVEKYTQLRDKVLTERATKDWTLKEVFFVKNKLGLVLEPVANN